MSSLVSSEFTALCKGQLSLLAQGVGASLSVVYLAEEWLGGQASNWIPVAVYPEAAAEIAQSRSFQLPGSMTLQTGMSLEDRGTHRALQPLYFNGHPIGLLVIAREGKSWQQEDYGQLEKVGYTLSAACAMERRVQWLQARFHQQELIQEQQQDLLDNLIHQFRNPLTALRTFGKLLMRRLSADDANHQVAEGIVRESDRLQQLLQQINTTIDDYGALPAASGASASTAAGPLVSASSSSPSVTSQQMSVSDSSVSESDEDVFEGDWESRDASTTEGPVPAGSPTSEARLMPSSALPPASPLTGKPLEVAPCQVLDILHPLLTSFRAIAAEKGQSIEFSIPQDPIQPVLGDKEALREVLSNLLDNALKYGNPTGVVAVTLMQNSEALTLCISDDGPGIPSEDLPRLFERHYRGIQATGAKPGTGLGLFIARALIEQMGGTLDVMSPADEWYPSTSKIAASHRQSSGHPGSAFLIRLNHSSPVQDVISTRLD